MRDGQFITKPLSLWLDLIRGLAALAVLVGHTHAIGLYSGPFPFSDFLHHNAVVVFFVLSGMVIANSVDRRPGTLGDFAIARAARILPVSCAAVAVTVLSVLWVEHVTGAPLLAVDDSHDLLGGALYSLVFLSESFSMRLPANAPYWSLTYEVWFYALFSVFTYLKGWARIACLLAMMAVAGINIVLMLPIWALGVVIVRSERARRISPSRARIFVAIGIAGLFATQHAAGPLQALLAGIVPWPLAFSGLALSDMLLAIAVGLGFVGLRALASEEWCNIEPLVRPIKLLAGMSFSLYLLHWPLLEVIRAAGIDAGDNPMGFVAIELVVLAFCYVFALATEHRQADLRRFLDTKLRMRRSPAVAA